MLAPWGRWLTHVTTDSVPVYSCDQDPALFREEVVLRSRLAKVLGCGAGTPASSWTVRGEREVVMVVMMVMVMVTTVGLLERGGGDWTWRNNFVDWTGLITSTAEQRRLRRGRELVRMLDTNITIRVFDPFSVHHRVMEARTGDHTAHCDH